MTLRRANHVPLHRYPLYATLLLSVSMLGCGGATSASPGPGGGGGKNCTWVGDPDRGGIARVCEDVWDCESLPNADKKCVSQSPKAPDGAGGWRCRHDGEHLICEKDDADAVGGGGWHCTPTPSGKRCEGGGGESGAPGGGAWVCQSNDDVGTTECRSLSDGDVPEGGGSWTCSIDKEFVLTCEQRGGGGGGGGGGSVGPTVGGGLAGGGSPCWCAEPSAGGSGSSSGPFAVIKTQRTTVKGQTVLKARVVYTKSFCDNTYGANAVGWDKSKKGAHKFKDLVGSDHSVLYFENCDGDVVAVTKLDYISEDASRPSGYGSLGVSGGDGKMEQGDIANVVAATSSLDVNFNAHGHVLTVDSPAADGQYKVVDPQYNNWIFEMWYEVDLKWSVFGPSGACRVTLESLHASPAKGGDNTVKVVPCPCK